MAYFKINDKDYSAFTSSLKVGFVSKYSAQTNAAGNTVVDRLNDKRVISVSIIPADQNKIAELLTEIYKFNVQITFLNPQTKTLETINCIIPKNSVNYYTIQSNKISFQKVDLEFSEL